MTNGLKRKYLIGFVLCMLCAGCKLKAQHYYGVDSVRFQMEKLAREQQPDAELAAWEHHLSERIKEQLSPKSVELKLERTTLTEVRVGANDKVTSRATRPVIWLYVILDLGDEQPTLAAVNEGLQKAVKNAGFSDSDVKVVGSRDSVWGADGWLQPKQTVQPGSQISD